MKYNFFPYFLSAYSIVLAALVAWFVYQFRQERSFLKREQETLPGDQ